MGQKEAIHEENSRNRECGCRDDKGVMVYSRRFGARVCSKAAAHNHGEKNAHKRAR